MKKEIRSNRKMFICKACIMFVKIDNELNHENSIMKETRHCMRFLC